MSLRYRVLQERGPNDAEAPVELARTRRYNGARAIRDLQSESAYEHLGSHRRPEDRVVVGPTETRPDAVAACLFGPNVFRYITTWIEPL